MSNRDTDSFFGLINAAIKKQLKFMVPREGKVLKIMDDVSKGRILVSIPAFGWDSQDTAVWCYSIDKNLLSTLKIDDWAIVQFVDGNSDFPICIGRSTRINNQLPINYDGQDTTHILFESPNDKIHIKYDESANAMEIGNSGFKESARIDDEVKSTSVEDSTFWTFWSTFFGIVTGPPIPEPGNGSPSAFQAALALAITGVGGTPSDITGKITTGSDQIKIGDQ